jgi:hypothetical protein
MQPNVGRFGRSFFLHVVRGIGPLDTRTSARGDVKRSPRAALRPNVGKVSNYWSVWP